MSKRKGVLVHLDIIAPVYGQRALLERCLASLEGTAADVAYRLIVVDDASPEDMESVYAGLDATILRHQQNMGFPRTVNDGVKTGYAPLVLLLNSDIELQPGCIQAMLSNFADPMVGIVGAKLLFRPDSVDPTRPAGKVQHAGIAFDIRGMPVHLMLGWDPKHPKANLRRDDMQAVTGALFMTRRSLWEKQKGFDTDYGKGTFEEIQYCLGVREMGYKIVYEPQAEAYHSVGASASDGFPLGANFALFRAKNMKRLNWEEFRFR